MLEGLKVSFTPAVVNQAVANVRNCLESGRLIHERYVPELEQKILRMIPGAMYVVTTLSNTAGHEVLFHVLSHNYGARGWKIVFPANAFAAPVFAAERAGFKPIFCDINPETTDYNLDELSSILALHRDVFAISVLSGNGRVPGCIPELHTLAHHHGAKLIEDAAHSFGAKREEFYSGNWADFTVLSFNPTKPVGFGQAGAVVGFDPSVMDDVRQWAHYGKTAMFGASSPVVPGFNLKMVDIYAAIGCAVLDDAPRILAARRVVADWYAEHLPHMVRQFDNAESTFYKFPVELPEGIDRKKFEDLMRARGIGLSGNTITEPTPFQPALSGEWDTEKFPGVERHLARTVCLPMHEGVSLDHVKSISRLIPDVLDRMTH